jgi:short-chain Z-isoprenyl diphosphate synthase
MHKEYAALPDIDWLPALRKLRDRIFRLPARSLIYRLYERRLLEQVRALPLPRHIGIILDGNRRFGRQRKLTSPHEVYSAGAQKLDDLLDWCVDLKLGAITLWVLSTDNFDRRPEEISGILSALEHKLALLAEDPQIHQKRICVRAIGQLNLLPESTLAALRAAEAATKGYDEMYLTIAAAYGGQQEIADAVQSLLREQLTAGKTLDQVIGLVTPEVINSYLYSPHLPAPDLIIRTSGEIRLSGFLLWQSAYSEFHFTDVFWPEFRLIDFLRAIRAFQQRHRRYGQ